MLFSYLFLFMFNQSIKHYIFHCPKNLQDYLGNKVNFSNEKIMDYFQKFEYTICNGKC